LNKLGALDTVIDCGLFHTFADEQRPVFVRSLAEVLRLVDRCTSSVSPTRSLDPQASDFPAGDSDAFHDGWNVKQLNDAIRSIPRPDDRSRAGSPSMAGND